MNTNLRALMVVDDATDGQRIRRCFEHHSVLCVEAATQQGTLIGEDYGDVDLAVVALNGSLEKCVRRVQQLRRTSINSVVVAAPTEDTQVVLQLIRSGAQDVICSNGRLEEDISILVNRLRSASMSAKAPGALIGVTGGCGGCGVSTIAANLAASLAGNLGSVSLLDLQMVGGDLMGLLNISPRHHLIDLCESIETLDHAMFTQSLEQHPCGIHLLAGPPPFQFAAMHGEKLTKATAQLLRFATACYPATVVDLEDCVHREQVHMAQESDVLLITFRMDFMSLYRARSLLDHLGESDLDLSKVRLVANRFGQPGEIGKGKATELLGRQIDYFIPDDPRAANMALNVGNPLVLEFPNTRIAKAIADMAESLCASSAAVPQ